MKPGEDDEFVEAWKAFVTWASEMPGSGTFRLARDLDHPNTYLSFAPWESVEAQAAWLAKPEFGEYIGRAPEPLRGLPVLHLRARRRSRIDRFICCAADSICAGDGDDHLVSVGDEDWLFGQGGDDLFTGNEHATAYAIGGPGFDTVSYENADQAIILCRTDSGYTSNLNAWPPNALVDIDRFIGSNHGDRMFGTPGDDYWLEATGPIASLDEVATTASTGTRGAIASSRETSAGT